MIKKPLQGIYAITDPVLMGDKLLEKAHAAIQGGISVLQYRNKQAPYETQLQQAQQLAELCCAQGVTFLINDNISLAHEVHADGVHLGQQDASIEQARAQLGDNSIIGITCHSDLQLAQRAEQQGASYVAFGRFFSSHTKPQAPPAEFIILEKAKQTLTIPVVAIGGIHHGNAAELTQYGVDMLAVIHGLFAADDVLARTEALVKIFREFSAPDDSSDL